MDESPAKIGVDGFDTYQPVIDYSTISIVRLLIGLSFGNNGEMFHWDILVAFTHAKAEQETYVRFVLLIFSRYVPRLQGKNDLPFKRTLYCSSCVKTAYIDLWFSLVLIFKPVIGHPFLFIRTTNIEGQIIVIVMGILVDDLLVTGTLLQKSTNSEKWWTRDVSWRIKDNRNII
jgi:hypothetical protein